MPKGETSKDNKVVPSVKTIIPGEEGSAVKDKIAVIGCGGFGTNMVRYISMTAETKILGDFSLHAVDTSNSNFKHIDGQKVHKALIATDGSGKERAANVDKIATKIQKLEIEEDMVILLYSLGGGSGSVIGPLLTKSLQEQGKTVVVLTVMSTTSEKEITNCIRTMSTIEALSQDYYTPIVLFDNSQSKIRKDIDHSIIERFRAIAHIMTRHNVAELDKSDIRNFLNPVGATGIGSLYVAYVGDDMTFNPLLGETVKITGEEYIALATLSINKDAITDDHPSRVAFTGVSNDTILGINGIPLNEENMQQLTKTCTTYNSMSTAVSVMPKAKDEGNTHASGIVL